MMVGCIEILRDFSSRLSRKFIDVTSAGSTEPEVRPGIHSPTTIGPKSEGSHLLHSLAHPQTYIHPYLYCRVTSSNIV